MTFQLGMRAAQTAVAAMLLTGVASAPSLAADGHWHGVRSNVWGHGIAAGISNWYSLPPPNGQPRAVPDNVAYFEIGAMTTSIVVNEATNIRTMQFPAGTPKYLFRLNRSLILKGLGIVNRSTALPRITVTANGDMFLENSASAGSAQIVTSGVSANKAQVIFKNKSRAGVSEITNRANGETIFRDTSTADKATIINQAGGKTLFTASSLGGQAIIENQPGGRLDFSDLAAGHPIGLFSIESEGVIDLDDAKVTLGNNLTLIDASQFNVEVTPAGSGMMTVKGKATLGGTINVRIDGTFGTSLRKFVVVRAVGQLIGKFVQVRVTGLPSTHKATVANVGKDVVVTVQKK